MLPGREVLEQMIEAAFWNFDARWKGDGAWKGRPQSYRDAFKAEVRVLVAKLDAGEVDDVIEETHRRR
jgi:hypothetical protein